MTIHRSREFRRTHGSTGRQDLQSGRIDLIAAVQQVLECLVDILLVAASKRSIPGCAVDHDFGSVSRTRSTADDVGHVTREHTQVAVGRTVHGRLYGSREVFANPTANGRDLRERKE